MMDQELERMKQINIADYAASRGYAVNRSKSSRSAVCMDGPGGDRIIIGRDQSSGHSVFYSVRDDQDHGTIVDFIQGRQGLSMGHVRKELRPWIGKAAEDRPERQRQPDPVPATRDRQGVARGLAACEPVKDSHLYLEGRGLRPETLEHFRGRVFADPRGNAIFPHFDAKGVSGLEIKNEGFTGFSKGGEKGLWMHGPKDPARVVVVESSIDAMSYYQLKPDEKTLYVSTSGSMSPEAKQNLKAVLDNHQDAEIVAAFDNDKAGEKHAAELAELVEMAGPGREVRRDLPDKKDWNEDLQAQEITRSPRPRPGR
ncbi:MAG: DUF3991 and toprim domain-containing protein [Trichloromonadaceae bacterium]